MIRRTPGSTLFPHTTLFRSALEGGHLGYLHHEVEGLSRNLERITEDRRGPLEDVAEDPAGKPGGPPGQVFGVVRVDVAGKDVGLAAVRAAACAKVLGEVKELVRPLHPARRAGQECFAIKLQSV